MLKRVVFTFILFTAIAKAADLPIGQASAIKRVYQADLAACLKALPKAADSSSLHLCRVDLKDKPGLVISSSPSRHTYQLDACEVELQAGSTAYTVEVQSRDGNPISQAQAIDCMKEAFVKGELGSKTFEFVMLVVE